MYQDISHSVIANPDMNRDDALSKLKTVAVMENELTQALVSDEEIANRPFRETTAEESAFKLQQMKINFADELQKNMAVSQPDASKIQGSIKQLYELEVLLMDKLFAAKNGKGRSRDKDKGRDTAEEPKRVLVKKSKKPSTVVEISFSDSEESGATPVVRVRKRRGDKPCPVHADPRGKAKITWSMHPLTPESLDLCDNDMQLLTGKDKRGGRLDDLGKSVGDNFSRGSQDFSVLAKTQHPPFMQPPDFPPYASMEPMYPHYAPYTAAPYFQQPPLMQPYGYPPQEDARQNVFCGDLPPLMDDRPPAEPRIIVPTRYQGLLPDQPEMCPDDELRTALGGQYVLQ
ncbi:hypothetical protein MTO96_016333 [Rhipicephalus appendiculatus]